MAGRPRASPARGAALAQRRCGPLALRGRRRGPRFAGVGSVRQREDDAEDGAAPWSRPVADGASMRLDQGADDRQAEPDASLAARARTVGAVEALEDGVGLL